MLYKIPLIVCIQYIYIYFLLSIYIFDNIIKIDLIDLRFK